MNITEFVTAAVILVSYKMVLFAEYVLKVVPHVPQIIGFMKENVF